jgi:hypothetical protein
LLAFLVPVRARLPQMRPAALGSRNAWRLRGAGKKLKKPARQRGAFQRPPGPAAAAKNSNSGGPKANFSSNLRLSLWQEELAETEMPRAMADFVLEGVAKGFRISNRVRQSCESVKVQNYSSVAQNRKLVSQTARDVQWLRLLDPGPGTASEFGQAQRVVQCTCW